MVATLQRAKDRVSAGEGFAEHNPTPPDVAVLGGQLSVSDFRNLKQIGALANDANYSLALGEERKISAYGTTVQARVFSSKGSIPGTSVKAPPLHFMSGIEFARLEAAAESRRSFGEIDTAQMGGGMTTAWFDASVGERGGIEIAIFSVASSSLPDCVVLKGADIKHLICSIHHELEHAAGRGEFCAYRREFDLQVQLGLRISKVTNHEIMEHIARGYEQPDVVRAEEEFSSYCRENNCKEEERAYWQRIEEKADAQAAREIGRGLGGYEDDF